MCIIYMYIYIHICTIFLLCYFVMFRGDQRLWSQPVRTSVCWYVFMFRHLIMYLCTYIDVHFLIVFLCLACAILSQTMSAVPRSKHCLLLPAADMSAVSLSKTSLLWYTADTSAVTEQIRLLCEQAFLLCDTADISAV